VLAVLLGLPLNLGGVRYAVALSGEDEAVRVGFLEIFGAIGLALVAVRAAPYALVSGLLFGGAMLASGGRAATLGIVVGLLVFLLLAREWLPLLATAFALLLIIAFAPPSLQSNPQIERLTTLNEQVRERNSRSFFYEESIKAFRERPIAGTGLGRPAAVYTRSPRLAEFLTQQLEFGGHATYHSLLKNFGLLGFLPFIAALLFAIVRLGRLIRSNQLAGFLFVMLIAQAIALIPAGNGSDPIYFLLLGAAAAVLAASRRTSEYRSTTAGTE
jgi:O-antigen ligase